MILISRLESHILLIFGSLGIACLFYFRIDLGTALQTGLQTAFIVALSVFGLQFIVTKIVRAAECRKKARKTQDARLTNRESEAKYRYDAESKSSRQISQQEFDKQAESYKERILVPREEAKQAKKEKEFQRFMGPAWKGKGFPVGGEDARSHEGLEVEGREAAGLRQLPPTEVKNLPVPKEPKKKQVIVLPDEPDENDPDCITVVLRTPIQTVHRRKFLGSSTVQNVLDFMTTIGFHQISYALATSYPRHNISDLSELTLTEVGFHRQVVLNVEEKEL